MIGYKWGNEFPRTVYKYAIRGLYLDNCRRRSPTQKSGLTDNNSVTASTTWSLNNNSCWFVKLFEMNSPICQFCVHILLFTPMNTSINVDLKQSSLLKQGYIHLGKRNTPTSLTCERFNFRESVTRLSLRLTMRRTKSVLKCERPQRCLIIPVMIHDSSTLSLKKSI